MEKGAVVFFMGIAVVCGGLALFSLSSKDTGVAFIGLGALMMIAGNR